MGTCLNSQNLSDQDLVTGIVQEDVPENSLYTIPTNLRNKAYELEKKLIDKFAYPLNSQSLYYTDVQMNFNGNSYLHTLTNFQPSNAQKDIVIFLHGYRDSSISFYKIIPYISDKYICFAPDLIGMGLSSRINANFEDAQTCLDFFMESLQAFVQALFTKFQLNFRKFILVGHSLGGYFATNYAIKHPDHIKQLVLLSPCGITDVEKKGGEITENMPWYLKYPQKVCKFLWDKKMTLQEAGKKPGVNYLFNFTLNSRYEVSKEESSLLTDIAKVALAYPKDLDGTIYVLFKHPFPTPFIPLEEQVRQYLGNLDIIFCYGEKDWVDNSGAKRLVEENPTKYKMFTIFNGAHIFHIEQPGEAAKILINEIA